MTARGPLVPLLVSALLGLSVPACDRVAEPTGQVLLYVTTDAPMGPPDGLFDRLIVEVIPPGEGAPCEGCTRSFAVDDARMAEGRAQFTGARPWPPCLLVLSFPLRGVQSTRCISDFREPRPCFLSVPGS